MLKVIEALDTELPQDKLVRRLCTILNGYLEPEQVADCLRAYHYSADAHAGQIRKSGEAYICHPISVAIHLAEMRMDANGIMAAILHDVIEDTLVSKETLGQVFNLEVAELVDGVTKLAKLNDISRAEAQAENVRKMFLAMAKDLRVIIVKLADRLHNMQTLGAMPAKAKRRIARETLDIYAPIANRLGMNAIRHQLEALGFAALFPMRQRILQNAVKKARGNRREPINKIETAIKTRLQAGNLECQVIGREKNLYSIYLKMLHKHIAFANILDVYAFRVLCEDEDSCYRILGLVHGLYKPIPGRFKDYIALPKANGYQSLHTVLIGPYGTPIEIQIRTHAMHRMSESGIAAHWLYKSEDQITDFQNHANEWLRNMMEIQKVGDSMEFIDNLKIDLFPQEVFVFTPQGAIIKLQRGATIVDFAYSVHTDIGSSCVSARIDKQLVPLQTKLENGMTVEIVTANWARPNPLWLNYVITAKARSSIRAYLKHFEQQEAKNLGRRLLENELANIAMNLNDIVPERITALLSTTNMQSFDELLENIGLGNKMPFLIAKLLLQEGDHTPIKLEEIKNSHSGILVIKGTEGTVVTLAKCCHPIPGDHIVGCFNPGRGIVVHHHECSNRNEARKNANDLLDVEWSTETQGEFPVEIRLELLNERGTLATIADLISKNDANIENLVIVHQDDSVSIDLITLAVRDRVHLAHIMRQLKKLSIVLKITRVKA